jgi:hypothetical protein
MPLTTTANQVMCASRQGPYMRHTQIRQVPAACADPPTFAVLLLILALCAAHCTALGSQTNHRSGLLAGQSEWDSRDTQQEPRQARVAYTSLGTMLAQPTAHGNTGVQHVRHLVQVAGNHGAQVHSLGALQGHTPFTQRVMKCLSVDRTPHILQPRTPTTLEP